MPETISDQEILTLLRELLAELLEMDISEVPGDANLRDGLCVESLQQLELMTRVEEELDMMFDIETWIEPETVADLARHIAGIREDRHGG